MTDETTVVIPVLEDETLEGALVLPTDAWASCCSLTAAVVDTAPGTVTSQASSSVLGWELCWWIC